MKKGSLMVCFFVFLLAGCAGGTTFPTSAETTTNILSTTEGPTTLSSTSSPTTSDISTTLFGIFDGFRFETGADGITILGLASSSTVETMTIPGAMGDIPVVAIADSAFENDTVIHTVIIPDGILTIGENAFSGCTQLVGVVFGSDSQILYIGDYAFANCTSLQTVNLPNRLDGQHSARDDRRNHADDVPLTTTEGAEEPSDIYLGEYAFLECTSLLMFIFPYGTIEVPDYFFYNCQELYDVYLPDTIRSIGKGAFYGCGALTEVWLPFGVETIGREAFSTDYMVTIFVMESTAPIGWDVEAFCQNAQIVWGCNDISRENWYYYRIESDGAVLVHAISSLTPSDAVIPDTISSYPVTTVGDWAFKGIQSLQSVTLPDSLLYIGKNAFLDCVNLVSIDWTENSQLRSIRDYAFMNCVLLSNLPNFPSNLTYIGAYAFAQCSSITQIEFPEGMRTIQSCAFLGCDRLDEVRIPQSVTIIGLGAFGDCGRLLIVVEATEKPAMWADDWCIFGTVVWGSPEILDDGSLRYIDYQGGLAVIGYSPSFAGGAIEIPLEIGALPVTRILPYALSENELLISVSIPSTIEAIEAGAFTYCGSLETIQFETGNALLTSIGDFAFLGCGALTTIDPLPESLLQIGEGAFRECYSLGGQITLPDALISIGRMAFTASGSGTIYIGPNVTWIGDMAFATSSLSIVIEAIAVPTTWSSDWGYLVGSISFAYEMAEWEGYEYAVFESAGYCVLMGLSAGSQLTEVVIPDEVFGLEVRDIGDAAFLNETTITSVTIPDWLTYIRPQTFAGMTSLLTVIFPENSILESVGNEAFMGCTSLISMDPPASITSYGERAFSGCSNLLSFYIPLTVTRLGYGVFAGCSSLTIYTEATQYQVLWQEFNPDGREIVWGYIPE